MKGYQVLKVLYTSEILFNNASIVTELCIKSKEEYRLRQKLKRINYLLETQTGINISDDCSIDGFYIEGMKICIMNDKIIIENNGRTYDFSREEFNRKTREVMGGILKY